MKFIGYDGEIEIGDGIIKIKKGKKDLGRIIKISDIVSVILKKPVFTAAGCIHIQVFGAKTYSSVANVAHYATDINTICFRKPQYEEAIKFKEAIEKVIVENEISKTVQSVIELNEQNIILLKKSFACLRSSFLYIKISMRGGEIRHEERFEKSI